MNKQLVFTVIKTLLTAVGAYLVGKNARIFGNNVIDGSTVEILIGAVMAIGSIIWSIVDKTAGIEQIQATIRQVVTAIGGLLISWGVVTAENLEIYLGGLMALAMIAYSFLSKSKTDQIANGKLVVVQSIPEKDGDKPKSTVSKPKDVDTIQPPPQDIIGKHN